MTPKTTQPRIHDNLSEWLYDYLLSGIAKAEEKAYLAALKELALVCGHDWEDKIWTAEGAYTNALIEGAFLVGVEFGRDPGRFLRAPPPHTEQQP